MDKEEQIKAVMAEYDEFCRETEEYCEEQGWPGRGSNYELITSQEWEEYYLPTIEAIEAEVVE